MSKKEENKTLNSNESGNPKSISGSDKMEKIVSLAKRRGFVYQGSEIYGGLAGTWDYGPVGIELKNNIKNLWWNRFINKRPDMFGVDADILMNQKVWQASGHAEGFNDPLLECLKCKKRFRADQLDSDKCPDCGGSFGEERQFNMMFKTHIGPVQDDLSISYLRPETAQGMFVNFKNVVDSFHPRLPFGLGQIGKAFRNEISPRDFIFRSREFEQMEIEYFVRENDWEKQFNHWLEEMRKWIKDVGLDYGKITELDVPADDRAHYSKKTVDFEYEFPFGKSELYGLAYRTDFDLKNHTEASKVDLNYFDQETNEKFIPHVIEPTFGIDRTVLAILSEGYVEEEVGKDTRIVLKLDKKIAPVKVAILPLSKKEELSKPAMELFEKLNENFVCQYDETQSIGKRYRRQDEIGTPYCVTFDFDSLEDGAVTVRDRDTMKQERIKISKLETYLVEKLK